MAPGLGALGTGLLAQFLVGPDGVHDGDAVPGEVGGRCAEGRGPSQGVHHREHSGGCPLDRDLVGPEAHDRPDRLAGVLVDAVQEAELAWVKDDEARRAGVVDAGGGQHLQAGSGPACHGRTTWS